MSKATKATGEAGGRARSVSETTAEWFGVIFSHPRIQRLEGLNHKTSITLWVAGRHGKERLLTLQDTDDIRRGHCAHAGDRFPRMSAGMRADDD